MESDYVLTLFKYLMNCQFIIDALLYFIVIC